MTTPVRSVDLLCGTAYLASLARRAALDSSDPALREQALKLGPLARELKALARETETPTSPGPLAATGAGNLPRPAWSSRGEHSQDAASLQPVAAIAAQPDFQSLMAAAARKAEPAALLSSGPLDRTSLALNMAQGGANSIEIARALGLTRGEVDLILNVARLK